MITSYRVKSIRKKNKLSQAKFAKEIGYSQGYIRDIELGKSKPSRRILEAISQRFNISIDWLLTGEEKLKKVPKYPHYRELLLISYEGKDREKIEKILSEGEYTLFESLIAANTVHAILDASMQDKRIEDFIFRTLAYVRSDPEYKNEDSLGLVEDCVFNDDIPKLKKLATFAFVEEPDALHHYFFQLFSVWLQYWDFDFNTFTLKIKLYSYNFKLVPLVISEPQSLFSDDKIELCSKLSNAIINTIKQIGASLTAEQKKFFYEILASGIEVIIKQAINEYLKEIS